eukprot:CAMPEP_0181246470 /NCGR_PEP_ID=MMETSP1096-20121128/44017_1 /TAXON_ID=156174 ORGANISM="Chrysochromulina ericina, Strain CCMP281" /NCGR_SAMPLE_ID=MMETSP1096 /ASSEMBLY_ACC=CAM_ASM_000453 /LENGTH=168 /DNA_ID=CAMNT_0023343301 /DNA_START=104 /DNA_END=610 /DNA_ORIENTATION=+
MTCIERTENWFSILDSKMVRPLRVSPDGVGRSVGVCAVKALRMPQKDEDVTCSFSDSLDFAHPPQARAFLTEQQRITSVAHEVTVPSLGEVGVTHFCWVNPGETLGGGEDGTRWSKGGFAYFYPEAHADLDCIFSMRHVDVQKRRTNKNPYDLGSSSTQSSKNKKQRM